MNSTAALRVLSGVISIEKLLAVFAITIPMNMPMTMQPKINAIPSFNLYHLLAD